MVNDRSYRIKSQAIERDLVGLTALQRLSDYSPANSAYSAAALTTLHQTLDQAKQTEIHTQNARDAARDATVAAEWAIHEAMLGAKAQVIAQYGSDSDAIQALGLKKKSKRRHATTRPAKSA